MNYHVFDWLGINKAHSEGFTGKGIKIGVYDKGASSNHDEIMIDVIKQVIPDAEFFYYDSDEANTIEKTDKLFKKMLYDGIDILNVSMVGGDFDHKIGDKPTYPTFNELKKRVIIVAGNGNSGIGELYYPAGYDDVFGIGACRNIGQGNEVIPQYCSYSTYNNKTLFAQMSNIWLTEQIGMTRMGTGTSTATAVQTGITGLLMCMFKAKFGKKWDRYDILENLRRSAQDVCTDGRDPYTGHGIPRLYQAELIDWVWWSKGDKHIKIDDWRAYVLGKIKRWQL